MKKTVIDFIEGRITPKDFLTLCQSDDKIFNWIQSIVPKKKTCYKNTTQKKIDSHGNPIIYAKSEVVPYDIRLVVQQFLDMGGNMLGKYLNIHHEISRLFQEVFPKENFKVSNKLQDQYMFMLEACPTYIGGNEVDRSGILEELLNNIPENLSQEQRIRWYRSQVKQLFHITANNYPCWIQEADWPMYNNSPMRFISQKKTSNEGVFYLFEDTETGKQRTVFQST